VTISMPDSITPEKIPAGYPAVLGYSDGAWATAGRLRQLFPAARHVTLTVFGGDLGADGVDCEPGNVNAAKAAAWVQRKLAASPGSRPVVYASTAGEPGYGMPWVLAELAKLGIGAGQVRKLSAHYGRGQHLCSPQECRATFTADGTQYTDSFPGVRGAAIDMSVLADDFFTASPVSTGVNWTEHLMQQLPELRQGATGTFVRTAQFQLGERGHKVTVDGSFGAATLSALKACQASARIAQDGVCGPVTWSALFGVQ
jgi:Putative peptidoglycan binding domain